jgi:hypothetical protein
MTDIIDPLEPMEIVKFGAKLAVCVVWGIPFAAIGIALSCTIFALPLALAVFGIAGAPMAKTVNTFNKKQSAWENRDILPMEDEVPWVI